jgi:3-hydroxy-9,10-secoandrosta-1,3,5(10)-triene-9,17-dione monooxygenase reductase component
MSHFCINVLGDHQRDVSAYFAGSWMGTRPPYHAFIPWEEAQRLEGAIAAFSCRQHRVYEGGDHWIVVGEVVAIDRTDHEGRPLVFYKGGYVNLEARGVRLEDAPMTIAWSGPFG